MAPDGLDGWAAKLLLQIKEAGSPAVEVKHTPREGNGWAKAETANFLVYHALTEEQAEKAVRIAEATRTTMTRKWFGEAATTWSPRCIVYLHPTVKGYTRETPAPAASPGHSTISLDAGRVVQRRIDLRCDDPNMFTSVLPHETTHVVLAGRFGVHHVPRWADEGMAVLSEPRERIELHLRNLPLHRREGTLFNVGELLRMAEYPEANRIGPFYAQGVSLVEFLCKKKDHATFTRFPARGAGGQTRSVAGALVRLSRFRGTGSRLAAIRVWWGGGRDDVGEAALTRWLEESIGYFKETDSKVEELASLPGSH